MNASYFRALTALRQPPRPRSVPPKTAPPYNYNTIEWLETFGGGTNWYDQAHSETVLEYLDFNYPKPQSQKAPEKIPPSGDWWCIEGGAQMLAIKMREKLVHQGITFNTRVTGIDTLTPHHAKIRYNGEWNGSYEAVFNSTTPGAMQQMDIRRAGLKYGQKQAIRSLGYGASAKVGMMFSEPWWKTKFGIDQAGLGHSDLSIRTTVYPSYNLHNDPKEPAVLLCSYTWQKDAQRISTVISSSSDPNAVEESEARLKGLVIRDLALLHAHHPRCPMTADEVYDMIFPMCGQFYAHDWYHDPNTFGAFAFFRPLQFGSMWPYIIAPSPGLIMIGEHASNHHAWVVGALESAVFGMYSWLQQMPIAGANAAIKAMDSWTEITCDNPFGQVPPWLPNNEHKWRAILSRLEHDQFREQFAEEEATTSAR